MWWCDHVKCLNLFGRHQVQSWLIVVHTFTTNVQICELLLNQVFIHKNNIRSFKQTCHLDKCLEILLEAMNRQLAWWKVILAGLCFQDFSACCTCCTVLLEQPYLPQILCQGKKGMRIILN